jgi:hypothetical protein
MLKSQKANDRLDFIFVILGLLEPDEIRVENTKICGVVS